MKKPHKKEKPKYNMWQNVAFMIGVAWREKEKKVLVMVIMSAMIWVASNLVNLYMAPTILETVEERISVARLIGTILVFVGLMMLFSAAMQYMNPNLEPGRIQIRMAIIAALNRKMAMTSYPNLTDAKFKKLYTKAKEATSSCNQPTEAIWETLTKLNQNLLGFLFYMLLFFSVELWMAVIIIITALIGYVVNKHFYQYEYRHREELTECENEMWYIESQSRNFSAGKDIRMFAMKPWFEEIHTKAFQTFLAFHSKANHVYQWGRIVDLLLVFLRNGIAYAYLFHLLLQNGLSASKFLLYFSAVGGFAEWVTGIIESLSVLYKQGLVLSTVRECLEYPEVFCFEGGTPLVISKDVSYELRLENVSFRYPESDHDILEHINLTLHPGEKLAIVGLNGTGKTTLVKLLCGFYDPTEGYVLLNGKDIRNYNRREYYKMFSAVFQEFSLVAGTIAANVAYREEDIDFERVDECIRQAGLMKKIESLPDGVNTYLNRQVYKDATMLSGGETQRLLLARALYKDAFFLLLDEPTAALDPIAEAELYQRYHKITKGKSSIYISHRLCSTRFCDRIIFLKGNRIAEEGTHEELLACGGQYAELYEVQSRYYRKGGNGDEV